MRHKHHIIPKHMGGSDDPSNIIELSVEEHAAAHKYLYEKYGKLQDKLAWYGLLGILSKEEILEELSKAPKTEEHKHNISKALKGRNNFWSIGKSYDKKLKGRPKTDLHKERISNSKKGKKREPFSAEWIQALKDAKQKQPYVECPHCGLNGRGPNMKRYHFDNCKRK